MGWRRPLACLALVAAAAGLPAGPARAAELDQAGWWSRGSVGPISTQPPSVPEGGLFVAGSPEGPVAIAAVRYTLAEGEASPVLTLQVAEDGDGDPTDNALMKACRAGSAWEPAEGGEFDDAPEIDCESGSVSGSRTGDGTGWSFRLTSLVDGDVVDVVILPGTDPRLAPGANGSTFQMTFEPPTDESLATSGSADGFSGGFDLGEFEGGDGGGDGFDPDAGGGSFDDGSGGGSGGFDGGTTGGGAAGGGTGGGGFGVEPPPPASVPSDAPAGAGDDLTALPAPGATTPTPAAAQPASSETDLPVLGIVLLVAAAAAALLATREPVPALRRLGRFGEAEQAPAAAAPVAGAVAGTGTVGGLGRFARPRTGPVPRL